MMKRIVTATLILPVLIASAHAAQLWGMSGNPADLVSPDAKRAIIENELHWEPRLPIKDPYTGVRLTASDRVRRAQHRFSLSFNDGASINDVMRALADMRGYSVEYGRGTDPERTLDGFTLRNVTWSEALQGASTQLILDITDDAERHVLLVERPDLASKRIEAAGK